MKKLILLSTAMLVVSGCETMPVQSNYASDQTRYVCYTYDYPAKHVLTLPVPEETVDLGELANGELGPAPIWFQGTVIGARYERMGLTQAWWLDDKLYIKVDPDNDAQYWDFRGAAEGETRKPEAVFECNKRG